MRKAINVQQCRCGLYNGSERTCKVSLFQAQAAEALKFLFK